MITICCPANAFPHAQATLLGHIPDALVIPIDPADILSPWREYEKYWGGPDNLLIVEQDIVIHEEVVPQLQICLEAWCVFPHPQGTQDHLQVRGIGCVRFRTGFMEQVPVEALKRQSGSCWECRGEIWGCWRHLDGYIGDAAAAAGMAGPHLHWPHVGHRDMPGGAL